MPCVSKTYQLQNFESEIWNSILNIHLKIAKSVKRNKVSTPLTRFEIKPLSE